VTPGHGRNRHPGSGRRDDRSSRSPPRLLRTVADGGFKVGGEDMPPPVLSRAERTALAHWLSLCRAYGSTKIAHTIAGSLASDILIGYGHVSVKVSSTSDRSLADRSRMSRPRRCDHLRSGSRARPRPPDSLRPSRRPICGGCSPACRRPGHAGARPGNYPTSSPPIPQEPGDCLLACVIARQGMVAGLVPCDVVGPHIEQGLYVSLTERPIGALDELLIDVCHVCCLLVASSSDPTPIQSKVPGRVFLRRCVSLEEAGSDPRGD
jgi:hypothetical protein